MGVNDGLVLTVDDLSITKQSEGCRLVAYPDPASPRARGTGASGAPWTIGYGHTGAEVHEGLVWTQAQADAALLIDMAWAEKDVRSVVTFPLTQDEFVAVCDFVFNCGAGNFNSSTLLRLLNAGDIDGAIAQFAVWNKAGGKVLAGLVKRRDAEAALFTLGANYSQAPVGA